MDLFQKQLAAKSAFGERLARVRIRLKLSQEALAEAIGTSARSISRWERSQAMPQQYYRERLCEVLQISSEKLFEISDDEQQSAVQSSPLWYVPYTRNPYFIGREAILQQLHERLHTMCLASLAQPCFLCGLGGIGKTQMALEYAYRFRCNYQAVFWIRAETTGSLMADYFALAHLFQLPQKEFSTDILLREGVKRWFKEHTNWLLVFDDVEDLELLHTMLPDASRGHVLITTRSQIVGTLGSHIDLTKMEVGESTLLLLRRAKLLQLDEPLEKAPATLLVQAQSLVELLDGFPLAIDQAGAYIEETACSLSNYLEQYAARRNVLLGYRGLLHNHHPASVASTLSFAFQQVENSFPVAADLLRLCAFLHSEEIPEDFIIQSGKVFDPAFQTLSANPLELDAAIRELRRFSLLHRNAQNGTFNIHSLLQVIILDTMDEYDCKQWVTRIIQALLLVFPDYENGRGDSMRVPSKCQQYLPHALACAAHIKTLGIASEEAEKILYRVGRYLQSLGYSAQAVSLLPQALSITEKIHGVEVLPKRWGCKKREKLLL